MKSINLVLALLVVIVGSITIPASGGEEQELKYFSNIVNIHRPEYVPHQIYSHEQLSSLNLEKEKPECYKKLTKYFKRSKNNIDKILGKLPKEGRNKNKFLQEIEEDIDGEPSRIKTQKNVALMVSAINILLVSTGLALGVGAPPIPVAVGSVAMVIYLLQRRNLMNSETELLLAKNLQMLKTNDVQTLRAILTTIKNSKETMNDYVKLMQEDGDKSKFRILVESCDYYEEALKKGKFRTVKPFKNLRFKTYKLPLERTNRFVNAKEKMMNSIQALEYLTPQAEQCPLQIGEELEESQSN
ncbi:hypothetical protein OAB57_03890 [Bacteriovoracaceae bacterium]|nr:hypothetical protein [Bacteriovoracaceae bacterium]